MKNLQPEQALDRVRRSVKPQWKTAFVSTLVIGLLAHLYKFTNHLPNWDSLMVYYYPTHNMIHQGRHLQGVLAALRQYVDAPWIVGLLCLVYIGIAAVLLVDLFGLKNRTGIVLLSGLIVTSSVVTSGYAFMYMADAFAGAYLLAVLAVWFTTRYRFGFVAGAVCLTFSMGSYQAYLPVAMAIVLLWMMTELLGDGYDADKGKFWKQTGCFVGMGILAAVFYKVSLQLLVSIQGVSISDHQGMGSMHVPDFSELAHAFKDSYVATAYFFIGPLSSISLYGILNAICLLSLLVLLLTIIVRKKIYCQIDKMILLLLAVAVYPCVSHLFFFVTNEVEYHALMQFSLVLIYLLLFWLYEKVKPEKPPVRWMICLSSVILIWDMALAANNGYRAQTLSYEKTYAMMERVVGRMEQLPDYTSAQKLAVIGQVPNTDQSIYGESPALAGITDGIFVTHQAHIVAMLSEYYGIDLTGAGDEELEQLKQFGQVQTMPCWPAAGSVQQLGDTIIVKFTD